MSRRNPTNADWNRDEYVTERTLKTRTQISTRHWQRLRQSRDGPPHIVIGRRCIRYEWGAVVDWLQARATVAGSATEAADRPVLGPCLGET